MKIIKRAISVLLSVILVLSAFPVSISAVAAGSGTEENPYQITTASQLQDINNNLSAHYKLMNNIDLAGMDFIPIGNANSGTFTGSFDGNGFLISNLNVFAGKYAGLFGCNEGKIKNVKLSDIYVYGTRYIGGVVGENTSCGEIENCRVLSGIINADSSIYTPTIGGICGFNNGLLEGEFVNRANITLLSGSIDDCIGGLVGRSDTLLHIQNSFNTGDIVSNTVYRGSSYSGGLVGYASKGIKVTNSYNSGNITAKSGYYSNCGGFVGVSDKQTQISFSYNSGNITSGNYDLDSAGGFVGYYSNDIKIEFSYNTGFIKATCAGAFFGETFSDVAIINNAYDIGIEFTRHTSISSSSAYFYAISPGWYDGRTTINATNCYCLKNRYGYEHFTDFKTKVFQRLDLENFKTQTAFNEYSNIWGFDNNINGGFPYLKENIPPLNISSNILLKYANETIHLKAYKNQTESYNLNWSVTEGKATVDKNGNVYGGANDYSFVQVTDDEGNKASYNFYTMKAVNCGVSRGETKKASVGTTTSQYISFNDEYSGDYLINAYSGDSNIVSVIRSEPGRVHYLANSVGVATIYFETAQGLKGSFDVIVTDTATSLEISSYTSTISRGNSYQFRAKTSPNPTSSSISWESSDESVATVDNSGKVTAVGIGSCRITVRTDNGYSAYQDITVNAPITSMEFEQPVLTIYKGDTQKLNLIYSPIDTTSTISFSVSSYSTYGGLSVDSSGVITANKAGTYKVRASSNGVETYCNITVKDIPVIVDDITLDQSEANIRVGEVFKLSAAVAPENATDKTVTWASTDESVAAVSSGGMVEAIGAGKAVITATSSNGIVAACEVTVTGTASINHAKLYIPDVISTTEGIVEVPVMIENNPGISFASYNVRYNPEAVEPIEVNNGDLFDCVLGSIESSENRVKLYFTSAETVQEDGVLASIRFRILDAGKAADIKLAYYPGNIREGEQNAVALNIAEGFVDLKYYPPFSLTYTCPEVAGRQATLIVSNGKTQYISESDNGVFFLDSSILGGTYDFYVKPRYGIATLVEKKFNFGSATLQSVEMEGHTTPILGDVNEDDVIDIADISMLLSTANYGKANTEIDLTGDGIISIDDISVALKATNYGMRSAIIVE